MVSTLATFWTTRKTLCQAGIWTDHSVLTLHRNAPVAQKCVMAISGVYSGEDIIPKSLRAEKGISKLLSSLSHEITQAPSVDSDVPSTVCKDPPPQSPCMLDKTMVPAVSLAWIIVQRAAWDTTLRF